MEEHKQAEQKNWFVKHRYISIALGFIILVMIVVFIVKNTDTSNQGLSEQEQVSPTAPIRHNNSRVDAASQDNPLQDHFNRAAQHLGL